VTSAVNPLIAPNFGISKTAKNDRNGTQRTKEKVAIGINNHKTNKRNKKADLFETINYSNKRDRNQVAYDGPFDSALDRCAYSTVIVSDEDICTQSS
jgi:hypothetical protein